MANNTRENLLVAALFLAVLAIRLSMSFQTQTLDSDAYFTLRQAEHIRESGLPLFNDPLSYGGRSYFFPPLFHYIVALLSFFMETGTAAKIVSATCLSIVVILVYAISKQVTKNRGVSYISAIFAGLTPGLYANIQNPSPSALSIVLILGLSYAFLRIEDHNMATIAVIFGALSLLTSTDLLIFIGGVFIYFIINSLGHTKLSRKEGELTIFLFLLAIWFNILLYKKAFLNSGVSTIWGNLPSGILSNYFQDITFMGLLYNSGVIPLFLGVYAIYHLIFESKSKQAQLFIGFAISSFLALWLKLVPISTGLVFFSTSIIILSSHAMKSVLAFTQKTKFSSLPKILASLVILAFLITSAPGIFSLSFHEKQLPEDIAALRWIRDNSPSSAVVLSQVEEGFLVSYFAQRKNVADSNFLFEPDASQTYHDVQMLYKLKLSSEAIRILNLHDVGYILISNGTREALAGNSLYLDDNECFAKVYDNQSQVFEFKRCTI